jgi:hypothetical protein
MNQKKTWFINAANGLGVLQKCWAMPVQVNNTKWAR